MSDDSIAVIGAGIVGICVAANLAEAGFDVTVYDRTGICEETSSGNAAAFAFSDVLPLVQKGMMRQVPRWLADPLGPLSIPPAYLPKLVPWLYRFWRQARPHRFEASLQAQGAMMRLAESEWAALTERSGTTGMVRQHGALELYEGEAEFRAAAPGWEAKRRLDIAFRHLAPDEFADYQPGLSDRFTHATFVPSWKNVADPKLFGKAVWSFAEARGARFEHAEIAGTSLEGGRPVLTLRDGGTLRPGRLVIAAGAWSHHFARPFGDRVPLETERGYNTTLPSDAADVRLQLIFGGHGFVITPLSTGLRVGGAVELGGLKAPPNYERSRAMLRKARQFLPDLRTEGGREWMGFRPSLPDSLPVIGRSSASPDVLYAFGHGHLGLTQSAAAGRLVRDLMTDAKPPIDLKPFSAQRF